MFYIYSLVDLYAYSCQVVLDSFLIWLLHSVAVGIEMVAAFHLNEKKQHIKWKALTMTCDNADGAGYTAPSLQSRACAQHVVAGLVVCDEQYSFHYTGDKGYAGKHRLDGNRPLVTQVDNSTHEWTLRDPIKNPPSS